MVNCSDKYYSSQDRETEPFCSSIDGLTWVDRFKNKLFGIRYRGVTVDGIGLPTFAQAPSSSEFRNSLSLSWSFPIFIDIQSSAEFNGNNC